MSLRRSFVAAFLIELDTEVTCMLSSVRRLQPESIDSSATHFRKAKSEHDETEP